MMYATNGKVQDLPSSSQFDFWNQVDWGIAFNIAKVEQNLLVGADRAPHQELAIQLLLDAVMRDKWSVWKSRPKGQQANWEGWGNFCSYYLRSDVFAQQAMLGEMIRGRVDLWFSRYLASNVKAAGGKCFWYINAPKIVYWDFHEFDRVECRSIRKIPPTWPTPQEIAFGQAYAQWWASLLGQNEAQKMVNSPPSAAQRAQAPSSAPQPAPPDLDVDISIEPVDEGGPRLDFDKITDEALAETGAPFATVDEFKAALQGPYQQAICDWFNSIGVGTRAELAAMLDQTGHSFEQLAGEQKAERAKISKWVQQAKADWPALNADAYERYLICFYDGLYAPPTKGGGGGLLWVVAAGAAGLGIWLFTRRG
jgi:hypothetical protein